MKRIGIGVLVLAAMITGTLGGIQWISAQDEAYRIRYEQMRKKRVAQSPPVVVAAAAEPTAKPSDGSVRKKLLLAVVRHRTIAKMQSEGVKGKKYTKDEAVAAWDNLQKNHPDLVDGAVAEGSPQAAAQVGAGGRLADFLQWLSDHSDQILAIVELILKILALVGDPMAMAWFDNGVLLIYPNFTILITA